MKVCRCPVCSEPVAFCNEDETINTDTGILVCLNNHEFSEVTWVDPNPQEQQQIS